jgi:hypothetical protein
VGVSKLKKYLAVLFVIFLFSPLILTNMPKVYALGTPPGFAIFIQEPVNGSTIYTENASVLFSVAITHGSAEIDSMPVSCYLDGQLYVEGEMGLQDINTGDPVAYGNFGLTYLSQGEHIIEIRINASGYGKVIYAGFETDSISATLTLFVNLGLKPELRIDCPVEFQTNHVSLKLTADSPSSVVSYSLDGATNVSLPQEQIIHHADSYQYEVNLPSLSDGQHTFEAYIKDVFNNVAKGNVTFAINSESSQETPPPAQFPAVPIIAGGAVTGVVITLIIVLYNKKNKV